MTGQGNEVDWAIPFLGEWTYQLRFSGEDVPAETGTDNVRLIGSWLVAESIGRGSDDSPSQMLTTLGYDPGKRRFVGAVVGTMTASLFVMDGSRDEKNGVLILETEGPAITEGKETDRYRDIWRITGPDTRELAAEVMQGDGGWREFMRYSFKRR